MKRYLCIGGPIAGEKATTKDMQEESRAVRDFGSIKRGDILQAGGCFSDVARQYERYNRGNGWGNGPSMVWIHNSLLRTSLG